MRKVGGTCPLFLCGKMRDMKNLACQHNGSVTTALQGASCLRYARFCEPRPGTINFNSPSRCNRSDLPAFRAGEYMITPYSMQGLLKRLYSHQRVSDHPIPGTTREEALFNIILIIRQFRMPQHTEDKDDKKLLWNVSVYTRQIGTKNPIQFGTFSGGKQTDQENP